MSDKVIEYFYSVSSPWAYMGMPRLIEIARRRGRTTTPSSWTAGASASTCR